MKKVFINTVHHSGTHFLSAILENIGYSFATYKNTFYWGKPYYRRNQRAGINWRTANLLPEKLKIFEKKTVPVSVSAPINITNSTYQKLFRVVEKGNFIIGHVPYSATADSVHQKNLDLTITIIRDPRDMVLSMIRHDKERPAHHAHHYLFNILDTDKERFFRVAEGYSNNHGHLIGCNQMINSMIKWKET